MRGLCVLAMALSVSACTMPTPVSVVTMGFDAVSYAVSGKTVTDHGVSLAVGRDCALVRILEGGICAEEHAYGDDVLVALLEPLPDSLDGAQLAAADPEVRAAVQRAARQDWTEDGVDSQQLQFAALDIGYLADGARPHGVAPILSGAGDELLAAAAPLPRARPAELLAPAAGPDVAAFSEASFLADATLSVPAPFALGGEDAALLADATGLVIADERLAALHWQSGNNEVGERPRVPIYRPSNTRNRPLASVAENQGRVRATETGR